MTQGDGRESLRPGPGRDGEPEGSDGVGAGRPGPGAPDDDPDLVRRARAGDEEAARRLYERHAKPLRRRVVAGLSPRLRQKIAASDILQEAVLEAFRSLPEFPGDAEEDFRRWLRRILENQMKDAVRRFAAQKRDTRREQPFPAPPAATGPTPSRLAMSAEQRAAVWAALDRLRPDYAQVIRMVHENGLPMAEVARVLDRSAEAARKLYARAIAALAREMGGLGESTDREPTDG